MRRLWGYLLVAAVAGAIGWMLGQGRSSSAWWSDGRPADTQPHTITITEQIGVDETTGAPKLRVNHLQIYHIAHYGADHGEPVRIQLLSPPDRPRWKIDIKGDHDTVSVYQAVPRD